MGNEFELSVHKSLQTDVKSVSSVWEVLTFQLSSFFFEYHIFLVISFYQFTQLKHYTQYTLQSSPRKLLKLYNTIKMFSVVSRGLGSAATKSVLRRNFASKVVVLSDLDAVEKVTDSSSAAVLYYTATWCPPCKVIKPVFHGLSEDHEGIVFGQVRVQAPGRRRQ